MAFETFTIDDLFTRCMDIDDGSLSMNTEEFSALRRKISELQSIQSAHFQERKFLLIVPRGVIATGPESHHQTKTFEEISSLEGDIHLIYRPPGKPEQTYTLLSAKASADRERVLKLMTQRLSWATIDSE